MATKSKNGKAYILGLDAGGTMTDTFLVDEEGEFVLGKAFTSRAEQHKSYIASVDDAASAWKLTSRDVHAKSLASIYSGTVMLNLLLMQKGQKIGLLITRGFEHCHVMERAHTWLGLSIEDTLNIKAHEHTYWMVDPRLVKGITERIGGGTYYGVHVPGTEFIPLAEEEVKKAAEELLDAGVEVIAILFLYSYLNPAHEERAREIVREVCKKRGVDVPVLISTDIAPRIKELPRLNSLLIEAFAGVFTREQLFKVEEAAKKDDYRYELLTLLAHGGVANIRHHRLYESLVSGPIGGMIGGKAIADLKGIKNLVCSDLGGTSYDVGIITAGATAIIKEPDYAKRRLDLPMVSVDSVSAGTGSIIRLDANKRITIGPDSAESNVGVCFRSPDITIGDVDVVLGYINPDYFLGGKVKLDKQRALEALTERLAKPLDTDVYKASFGVLEIFHTRMREFLYSNLLARGYNPREYILTVYGGAGPLHLWGACEGIPYRGVITVPWAAAFSAFGVTASEYSHRYQRSISAFVVPAMGDQGKMMAADILNSAWEKLENEAYQELEHEGFPRERVIFKHGIFARYIGQMESFEIQSPISRANSVADMDKLIAAFEKGYLAIYPAAGRFPEAGYLITDVVVQAMVKTPKPVIPKHTKVKEIPNNARKGKRKAFYKDKWMDFSIFEMDFLKAGNIVDGPAIIEHSMTTFVIPPGKCAEFDEHKVIWYRDK